MVPPRAEYPLISGVEHVGMEGVDGENVLPYMGKGGENLSPGASLIYIDVGKPRRERLVLVL